MKRWAILWAVAVFSGALLLGAPVSFWARWVNWPDGWQPQALSGSLWQGQAAQLGPLGPVSWQLALVGPRAEVRAGALQRQWHLQIEGWPWQWQARLKDAGSLVTPEQPFSLEGDWQGHIEVSGRGRRCLSSTGSLRATQLDLLAPWTMPLGQAELTLDCQDHTHLLARLERAGQHQIAVDVQLAARTTEIDGRVASNSQLSGLLRQIGVLEQGQQAFQTRFTW
ncbi:general secretion pathway protein N [Pseudomonas cuatrocienegasensis]|uniref:General secretion pathway protein N n=1 Tax=Pseudomonas cuatrocienegasensis TaxID=543360 RepID=A0ABY1BDG8_9PSED|nr:MULTISPECIES: hypothetical protein [Pseudomonas]OEC33828.1 hypothetical protein A7D25_17080 [Pseudomonas sp. 21C1]SEQ59539.1 general secretion pathway protein N [Pseudomonas cuatrocienegasensis]